MQRERRENMKSISTGAISEDALYVTSIFGFYFFFSASSFVGVRRSRLAEIESFVSDRQKLMGEWGIEWAIRVD